MAEALLITRDDVVKFTAMNGNVDTDNFIQWYTIANKGVFKHNSENATNVEKDEIDFLIEKERSIAQHYTERFIDYMAFNQASFPEYNLNSNGDMYPDTQNNYFGWFI